MANNFEPYLDWAKITDEQAKKLASATARYKRAADSLCELSSPQRAGEFMQAHQDLGKVDEEICMSIWTVPAMVHVAAERDYEEVEGETVMLQRCQRCKSILHFVREGMISFGEDGRPEPLTEENVPWFDPGQMVAKATRPDGMSMYLLQPGQDLEPHEMECVGFPNLEDPHG